MLAYFFELEDRSLVQKISQPFLTVHLLPYWKKGKRFTRKFWENPDANDPDVTAAFRKRNEAPRMLLRRNEISLKQKYEKKKQMKDETVNFVVTKLLPQTWKREVVKQSLDLIHDAKFDRQYEAMLKEKNIQS